ncbi:membrane protein [Actinorhabdospora filicis]|uniref:Membrane protein n=1 Tax=Actinorhabdospora filicis TaxID=1785913 RepID=A0A9W6SQB9_9ACTN|nr:low temperature requirement protein A [Actinorhabdospora filicis]GLZ78806.1 membrane protein [Actinorhabdospora filicis]
MADTTRPGRAWIIQMSLRDHGEGHRVATPLELLFDLSFVVAVAQAALQLEHGLAEGHTWQGIGTYLMIFAAIWWAWMNFTWFANAFDTDDVPYRLLTLLQIAGSLGLAAGIPAMAHMDFTVGVISYVVMRIAYVLQWARARGHAQGRMRAVATRMIISVTLVQLGWVAYLAVPHDLQIPLFIALFALDVLCPAISGWDIRLGGHRHHIAERYGLFTIIVLGESITAATIAISNGVDKGGPLADLLVLAAGGLLIVFAIWWLYFDYQGTGAVGRDWWRQFLWGYGHYFIFAAVAAVGAGLALAAGQLTGHATEDAGGLPAWGLALAIAVPVAVFLGMSALFDTVAEGNCDTRRLVSTLITAAAVLAACALAPAIGLPWTIVVIGTLMALLTAGEVIAAHRRHALT